VSNRLREIEAFASRAHEMTASDPGRRTRYSDTLDLVRFAQRIREIYDGPDPASDAMDLIAEELHRLENP